MENNMVSVKDNSTWSSYLITTNIAWFLHAPYYILNSKYPSPLRWKFFLVNKAYSLLVWNITFYQNLSKKS